MKLPFPCLCFLALVCATVAGCSEWSDAYEARTCRRIVAALNPQGSTIEIGRAVQTGVGRIEVVYTVIGPEAAPYRRRLACWFDPNLSEGDDRLAAAWSDGKPIGEVRLALLKRFWLTSSEPATADPAPYVILGRVPEVPKSLAVALQHALSALPLISVYALLAAAYALAYGLLGRINLAFGEFAAVGSYGAILAFAASGASWLPLTLLSCVVFGLWAAAVHGAVATRLVFAPLRHASGQQLLIATVGLAIALQEYLRLTQGSALRWVAPLLNQPIAVARHDGFVVAVTPVAGAVGVLALLAAVGLLAGMRWTRFGRHWRACADDPLAASLMGVDAGAILARTLVLATVLAGLAGVAATLYYGGLGFAGGVVLGLKSLIAAIIGGIGSLPGAFVGGLAVGSLEALWSALFPIEYRDLAVYTALVAFLIWRPGGILGQRQP